ncbi:dihydroxyacetone kinase subunit L [Treponema sp. OMZ 840]|uniref:dihydroxyacetone kinase subunit L n=1 Tax=Treponema sp. OMZ 840 TaxID=244313 RepID=UPI003D8D1621
MNAQDVKEACKFISNIMTENKNYLIQLDQQNGDGDLGISMSEGYKAVSDFLNNSNETDLGKMFMQMSMSFNEKAPSSLGTITSIGMMGISKALKGKTVTTLEETAAAFKAGIEEISAKCGSKIGEKTILDALIPAIDELEKYAIDGEKTAFASAAAAAAQGSEKTKNMRAVHGRAAYYAEKSIGVLDGGSVVGKLIFEAISNYCQSK